MEDSASKLKHLEFIQAGIGRMAANSFLLKGWSVTLVAALFALAAKDANSKYFIVAYLPVAVFWVLDAYFLMQERRFRALYDDVRTRQHDVIDFSMDTSRFKIGRNTWPGSFLSPTLLIFYLPLVGGMLLVMRLIK